MNKNKATFILSEKELKKQQKESLIEMNKLDNKMRKVRKK